MLGLLVTVHPETRKIKPPTASLQVLHAQAAPLAPRAVFVLNLINPELRYLIRPSQATPFTPRAPQLSLKVTPIPAHPEGLGLRELSIPEL